MQEPNPSYYWDAFPKSVKQSYNAAGARFPIRIEGQPHGAVTFQSCDPEIATVENGWIRCGTTNGSTLILATDSAYPPSVRHIQVEVYEPTQPNGYGW